jgi:thioredoxin-related protein
MTKKTYLIVFLSTFLVLFLAWLFLGSGNSKPAIKSLPDITLKTLDSTPYSLTSSPGQKLLIFFNSQCDHCHTVAADLQPEIDKFPVSIFWISTEPVSYIKLFSSKYNLHRPPLTTTLQDTEGRSYTDFKIRTTPTMILFDQSNNLLLHSEDFDDHQSFLYAVKVKL